MNLHTEATLRALQDIWQVVGDKDDTASGARGEVQDLWRMVANLCEFSALLHAHMKDSGASMAFAWLQDIAETRASMAACAPLTPRLILVKSMAEVLQ